MFPILDIVADEALATTKFACDLGACKGACCTMPGGRGAPVDDGEVADLLASVDAALPYLSDRNRQIIRTLGPLEGRRGDQSTRCIDNSDCVFVYYENDVAKCAVERAHFNGETPFRKPISCHLFPIRVSDVLGATYLRYEQIPECDAALTNGKKLGIPLYRFLKDALTRAFGAKAYKALVEQIEGKALPKSKSKKR
ncbi:MAG: DUF3109 family protein [bacterium]|nr:DUF3109 family protein [Candidatus Kapabacteria bacterium]